MRAVLYATLAKAELSAKLGAVGSFAGRLTWLAS